MKDGTEEITFENYNKIYTIKNKKSSTTNAEYST